MKCSRFCLALLLAAVFAVPAAPVRAQDYPSKRITLVVGYGPGGGADAIARLIGQKLAEALGAVVVVDNRPGFSGNLAARQVAQAHPDGYTLLVAPWTTYAINSLLYPTQVGYDLRKDFAPVSTIGTIPLVLVVDAALPVKTVAEFVTLAKGKPGGLSYATTGNGSLEHMATELFRRQAGVDIVHVPYKTASTAVQDTVGGQIQVMFVTASTAMPHIQAGRLRPLMVTVPARNDRLPGVPTPAEAGYAAFGVHSTYGLLAPAGTPAAVIERLNTVLAAALRAPDVAGKFQAMGIEPAPNSAADASRQIAGDLTKWANVVRDAGIKADDPPK